MSTVTPTPTPTPTPSLTAAAVSSRPRWPWMAAIRPKTLPAAVSPVMVGVALAVHDLHAGQMLNWATVIGPAIAAAMGALFLQIAANLANDYFDFVKGADTATRIGPPRAAQQGWISPRALALGTATALGMALVVGIYLASVGGWPIVAIGVASMTSAVLYTGGPKPLGYLGLGDLFVFVFFGLVAVGGTYYVITLNLTWATLVAAVPIGALITAILVVNNLRDRHTDAQAGKRTLAVRWGATGARLEYTLLVNAAFGVPIVAWMTGMGHLGWLWPVLIWPVGWIYTVELWVADGAHLNPLLGATARLGLLFGILFSVGVLL